MYYRGELQVLIKLLERRPADLMHVYFGHTGVHLLPLIQEWEQPCVVSFHGMDIQRAPAAGGLRRADARAAARPCRWCSRGRARCSPRSSSWGCPREKLRLNRTGIPLDDFPFTQRPMPADGSWRFVQACRLIAKKGLRTALRAFAKFRAEHPRAQFHDRRRRADEAGARRTRRGAGRCATPWSSAAFSRSRISRRSTRAHVFLHPSEMTPDQNQEGVPNSMLEAMATGLPVLATHHGGIPEAVTHERTGLLVPERDDEALLPRDDARSPPTATCSTSSARPPRARCARSSSRRSRSRSWRASMTRRGRSEAAIGRTRRHGSPSHSFAYLFERFPSFVQTFVYREAVEMVRQGMAPWLVSIRQPDDPGELAEQIDAEVFYLPEEKALRAEIDARRAASSSRWRPRGRSRGTASEPDSQRMFEAIWLAPRLRERGDPPCPCALWRTGRAHGVVAAGAVWLQLQLHRARERYFLRDGFPDDQCRRSCAARRFIVTETDYARRWMEEKYPFARGKVFRVFNGIETERLSAARARRTAPAIVSVGRYVEKKGFDDLIEACRLLRERGVEFDVRDRRRRPAGERCFACRSSSARLLEQRAVARPAAAGGSAALARAGRHLRARVRARQRGRQRQSSHGDHGGDVHRLAGGLHADRGHSGDDRRWRAWPACGGQGTGSTGHGNGKTSRDPALAKRMGARGRQVAIEKFAIEKTVGALKRLLVQRCGVKPPAAACALDPSLEQPWWRRLLR